MRKYFVSISIILCLAMMTIAVVKANQIKYFLPSNIQFYSLTKPMQKQVECLAENIYFEAGHEPKNGQQLC